MRIAQIAEAYGGGVFTSVNQLCNGLAEAGDKVLLVCSPRPEAPSDYKAYLSPQVEVLELSMCREISIQKDLKSLVDLMRALAAWNADVVHVHSSKAGMLGRLACALLRQKAVVYSPRGYSFLQQDCSPLKRTLYKRLEQAAALMLPGVTVGCSLDETRLAREIGAQTVHISNSIDLRMLDAAGGSRPKTAEGAVTIAFSGRISPAKNPAVFGRIATKVMALRPEARFVWIGDGDRRMLGGAPVEVTGWRTRQEALAILKERADIYLFPSAWEGLPLALLEAQALRLPAVASNIIGNRDVIQEGETGFLCNSEEELVLRTVQLIDDAALRGRMGSHARDRVEKVFAFTRMLEQYRQLYGALANSQGKGLLEVAAR